MDELIDVNEKSAAVNEIIALRRCLKTVSCAVASVDGLSDVGISKEKLLGVLIEKNIVLFQKGAFNEYERKLVSVLFCDVVAEWHLIGVYIVPDSTGEVKWHVFEVVVD